MITDKEFINAFGAEWWRPEQDKQYTVVLANWRLEEKTFKEAEGPKVSLVFDVLRVGAEEYPTNPPTFTTRARSFIEVVKPWILEAQEAGKTAIKVLMRYNSDKSYDVMRPDESD